MDSYSLLREIADSWGLLALTLFFIGVIVWAFRPGSRQIHDDIAQIPLRNDQLPAEESRHGASGAGNKKAENV